MIVHIGKLHRRKDMRNESDGDSKVVLRHRWLALGAAGAVQFVCWQYLPNTAIHAVFASSPMLRGPTAPDGSIWNALDLGLHSPRPLYPDHEPMGTCDVLEGQCFYDGSSYTPVLLCRKWAAASFDDDAVIWPHLERFYRQELLGEDFT